MNKRILFIVIIFFLSIFFTFFIFFGVSQKIRPLPIFSVPTPTPQSTSTGILAVPIKIVSVSPLNGATGISPNQQIIITFNQPIATTSVRFSIFPEINHSTYSRLNSIIIVPESPYQENVVYTYGLFTNDSSPFLVASFSAGVSQNPIVPLVGRYPNLDTVADNAQRENFPDVFLAGYSPYSSGVFSVSSSFSSTPSGHYVFTVSPNTDGSKQGFLSWLKRLGLNQTQINRITVVYQ